MTYFIFLLLMALVQGVVAVASNPTPYFAAFGLVVAAGVGCGVLVGHRGSFLWLVLFLIYLGGMHVVFAYSAALAAEPFPEAWGSRSVLGYVLAYLLGVGLVAAIFWGGWYEGSWVVVDGLKEFCVLRGDISGVAVISILPYLYPSFLYSYIISVISSNHPSPKYWATCPKNTG
uniref:NADH-ubiquinone oxidoreductase chain 6 n=1 Tax=Danio margaritatus TaxID=487618 RepID=A0A0S1YCU0_9TELE|nr:NADH dehydrogenase subunit 6 [Danio margaritatus]ALM87971.1 NADH dehydrogenase subunit 6 [Danio margaritatus]